jgi:toxin HigB-1
MALSSCANSPSAYASYDVFVHQLAISLRGYRSLQSLSLRSCLRYATTPSDHSSRNRPCRSLAVGANLNFKLAVIFLQRTFTSLVHAHAGRTHAERLRMQLGALDTAAEIDDLDIPGYRLHPLKGNRKGIWSISVNGNWRLTFEFSDGNVYVLNYEDYH